MWVFVTSCAFVVLLPLGAKALLQTHSVVFQIQHSVEGFPRCFIFIFIYAVCQVLCLGEAILFCENCEAAITKNNLEKFLKSLENQLESYTQVLDHMDILMLLAVELV